MNMLTTIPIEPFQQEMFDINLGRMVEITIDNLLVQVRLDNPVPDHRQVKIGPYHVYISHDVRPNPALDAELREKRPDLFQKAR